MKNKNIFLKTLIGTFQRTESSPTVKLIILQYYHSTLTPAAMFGFL